VDPYIGEIRMFAGNFAPVGWLPCDGRLLNISQFDALYMLLGTTYGGDGQNTFGLPDLRGRTPIHQGQGQGLTSRLIGQMLGSETVTLTQAQLPVHPHPVNAYNAAGDSTVPTQGCVWSAGSTGENQFSTNPPNASMAPAATSAAGGGAPHDNMMPFQAVSFIIATDGVFPPRN
jgi:microcystin-dependent protein